MDTPVTLQPSTTYWVVAEAGPGDWYRAGTAEDSGAAAGWSIGDNHEFRTAGNTRAFTQSQSAGALKIEINGPATNSPAAGAPAITAPVLRVPATLVADLSGITDTDGAADIAPTVAYRWQRFASDGMTLRRDNIGTDATYTLTDADVGKTIKVMVSFEDDNGFSEGPLTSDATSAVWQCPEPDLQGGATLIEGPRRVGIESYTVSTEGYHGYRDILFREHGTLDDDTFSTTATPTGYTIEAIEKTITAIWLNLDKALAAADKQSLALHVCKDHYALSDFTLGAGTLHGYFIRSDQDWSSLPEVTFHISEDLVAPSFAEAWGDGTSLVIAFSEKLRPATSLSHNSFSVTRGANDDTVTLSSATPTVSGNMVELTLSDAITASDTNIKVSYNKPNAGSGNRVADRVGNEAASFSGQPVINLPADSVAPTLSQSNPATLASDGKTLTLTMNEAMKTDSLPTSTAFTVEATPSGGSEAEVHLDATTPVEVSGSAVTLNLGTPIAHNDTNVKVSYTVPGSGGKLQDRAGNDLASFTDQIVTNHSAIPRVGIEALHDDATPVIALPRFRFTASTAPSADLDLNLEMTQTGEHFSLVPVTIDAHNNTVEHETVGFVSTINEINEDGTATITVVGGDDHLPMLPPHNSATVEAKLPPTGPSVWVSHQQLAYSATEGEPFSIGVVFNAGEGVAQPRQSLQAVVLTEDSGTATINRDYTHVSAVAAATPSDWTPTGAGGYTFTHRQPIEIIDDGLYEPDAETFTVYMEANMLTSDKLVIPLQHDAGGSATITITSVNPLGILEIALASTPTGGYYGDGDTIQIKVTFNGHVTVDTAGGTPEFDFELAGDTRQATYASRSGTSDLIFNYTVTTADRDDHDGISWTANSLDPNGGTIHPTHLDVNRQVTATLTHVAQAPLANHKVDTRKPELEYAETDGATLTLNHSEDLKSTAPPNTAFTVSVDGGAGANPTNVAIANNIVTLTLTSAVGHDQTAMVSYTYPGQNANPLQDLTGKEAEAFSNVPVDQATELVSFRATPGDRRVLLEWNRLTDSSLTRYQYRYMITTDTGWNPDWTDIPGSNASTTSFTASNLTNGVEYTFQVRPVYTRGGQTEHGKEGEAKSAPRSTLIAPAGLAAAPAGTGEIVLSWDDPNDVTITGYQYRYQTPSDTGWNPDWQDIPGSDATTTSHTLSNLAWEVLHTFELRAVRDNSVGPATQTQATPPGDATSPSQVRELRAVVLGNSRVQLYFRAPARSGDANLSGFEYRYADSDTVPETVSWQTAASNQVSSRFISISGLEGNTLYTFQVRAVNGNSKQGPAARVQATTTATPTTTLAQRAQFPDRDTGNTVHRPDHGRRPVQR